MQIPMQFKILKYARKKMFSCLNEFNDDKISHGHYA